VDAGDHTGRRADQTGNERRRVTVAQTAEILGITAEAVRTRIKRGKLDSVKEPDAPGGTVYVLLPADQTRPNIDPTMRGQDQTLDQTELVEELRDRVAYLERQVEEEREARRRADMLMAQLVQRVPELEAPREPGGATEQPPIKTEPAEPADPVRSEPDREDPERAEPEKVGPERPEREEPERPERVEPVPPEPSEGQETASKRPWWRRWLG
jgi:hypothetical protein